MPWPVLSISVRAKTRGNKVQNNKLGSTVRNDIFRIQIDGIMLETLKSVSGLSLEVEVVTSYQVRGATGAHFVTKTPGKITPPSITLVRGMDQSKDLTEWIAMSRADKVDGAKKNVTIELMNSEGTVKRTATLFDAWVSKWSAGELTAAENGAEVDETVVIECDRIAFT
ncbi:phage tail protein [Streptomyces olivoreticuli]|uniref:phage tail protein n=1 Tax=Streptomyces olivoreticuli TaxID=68246 RepID=UPI003F5CE56D